MSVPWPRSRRRFLVFTSAGSSNNIHTWLPAAEEEDERRDWDLCIVRYRGVDVTTATTTATEEAERFERCWRRADHRVRHEGGKFPNLAFLMARQPDYFAHFEAVLVADDDVVFQRADAISAPRNRCAHAPWTRFGRPRLD